MIDSNNSSRQQAYKELAEVVDLLNDMLSTYILSEAKKPKGRDLIIKPTPEDVTSHLLHVKAKAIEAVFGLHIQELAKYWGFSGRVYFRLMATGRGEDFFLSCMGKEQIIAAKMFIEMFIVLMDNFTERPDEYSVNKKALRRKISLFFGTVVRYISIILGCKDSTSSSWEGSKSFVLFNLDEVTSEIFLKTELKPEFQEKPLPPLFNSLD
ncbi:hypothetical protein [Moorena sp. SIO3B2]|uniref:hypothetical protein n=1 Tax=Moorena sp. SIO3B2 TaxID=2607827 RepID=UPI0013C8797E|nr:hypothetical protein [Moorena sp. SIO3B2]NEP31735.1 hypothetical protein [Moorena sp. SIO3B2]NEP31760.1 hypothetical protein [Moorena sp. SIO3B2]